MPYIDVKLEWVVIATDKSLSYCKIFFEKDHNDIKNVYEIDSFISFIPVISIPTINKNSLIDIINDALKDKAEVCGELVFFVGVDTLLSLLKDGIFIKVVSERLGHSSVQITLDTYAHVLPSMQDEAAERIDSAISDLLRNSNG